MTFLLDQDVPDAISRVVQQAGHEPFPLSELISPESPDDAVLAFAHARNAVLVTCNRDDFLVLAKSKPHAGIVIVIRRESVPWNAPGPCACCSAPGRMDSATTSTLPELVKFA